MPDKSVSVGTVVVGATSLVQYAADAALAVDANLRVVAWNQRAEELLGYQASEVQGRPCWTALGLVQPDGAELCAPNCAARLCFTRCLPYSAKGCRCRHKQGHWIDMDLSSITIPLGASDDGALAILFLRPIRSSTLPRVSDRTLRIYTLGCFALRVGADGIDTAGWQRKQPLTLLKHLVTHRGHSVHAEQLAEAIWPDAPEGRWRGRLKVAIHFLRQQLRQAGLESQTIGSGPASYVLRRDGVWVDADAFETLVREGEALERRADVPEALLRYQEAESLYGGDYMEEEPYADWCVAERERLRERYLGLLERMADLYARGGMYQEAAHQCRKALVREPCREGVHRALMGYLWRLGRRAEALAQFRACAQVLARELDAAPSPETQSLYQRIAQSQ